MNYCSVYRTYDMSLLQVSNMPPKTFEKVRRECLKEKQYNGIYFVESADLIWLNYEDFMVLRDIVELRTISNHDDNNYRKWRLQMFCPSIFYEVYQDWMALGKGKGVLITKKQRNVIKLLSSIPLSVVESMKPQEVLKEMIETSASLSKLVNSFELNIDDI